MYRAFWRLRRGSVASRFPPSPAAKAITRDNIPVTSCGLQSPVHGFDSRLRLHYFFDQRKLPFRVLSSWLPGLASRCCAHGLKDGIQPVQYGDGEQERILATTDRADAFIDAVGGGYIDLAINLGVPIDRIDTVVDYRGAKEKGVKSLGTTDAGGPPALAELAALAATSDLHIPIAATYPLTAVRDAYQALADRKTHGRIVLHPQDLV
jgi:hypothetical protein